MVHAMEMLNNVMRVAQSESWHVRVKKRAYGPIVCITSTDPMV